MTQFLKLFDNIDVLPALLQLHDHPELWNEFPERAASPDSPHYGVSDVWLRYRDRAELNAPKDYIEPHFSVWYPGWAKLPALRPIVFALMSRCEATALGGVMLTRIPAGGEVKPHDDAYSWHARHYNRKVYVPLRANPGCINRCEGEAVVMPVGTAWTFNNLVEHSVENHGDEERITLIVCMRAGQ